MLAAQGSETQATPLPRRIALIGAGVIGSGWAARALGQGLDVALWDPSSDATARVAGFVERAWPAMLATGVTQLAAPPPFRIADSIADAVDGADWVQESAPENEQLKRDLAKQIDARVGPDVVIASSSSGLLPTVIQQDCSRPERVLIGHPFNPVYLLPLVEIVAGTQTDDRYPELAAAFYSSLGMRPLRVRSEVPGYISDRLQEAVWREALHLVARGVATTREIDDAIAYGPGLRWAFMGQFLIFHMAGGPGGMQHFMDHIGWTLELPWTELTAPELTDELVARVVAGTAEQADSRPVEELERWRDERLVAVINALKQADGGQRDA
jgi:carnitine 3-dehydrogenase